jgi:hypothetical protein
MCSRQSPFVVKIADTRNTQLSLGPITVDALSKTRNIFARSSPVIMDSNHNGGMDICPHFFCVCLAPCVAALRQG